MNHNRARIPAKFDLIDIGDQVLYSVYDANGMQLLTPSLATVMKRRYITMQSAIDCSVVFVVIHRVLKPRKILVKRVFQGKVTKRKHVKLPNFLGLRAGDRIVGSVMKNLTTGTNYDHVKFDKSISAEGSVQLPIPEELVSSKDRIQYHVDYVNQLPENQVLEKRNLNLEMVVILVTNNEIQAKFASNSRHLGTILRFFDSHSLDYAALEAAILQIDMLNAIIFKNMIEDPIMGIYLIYWVFFSHSTDFPIYRYLDSIRVYHQQVLQRVSIKSLVNIFLRTKYNELLDHLGKAANQPEVRNFELPLFLPIDIIDRTMYSVDEASILSVVVSRLVDGYESTSLEELAFYLKSDGIEKVAEDLIDRGVLIQRIRDESVVFGIPRFHISNLLNRINREESRVMVIHSFGGGVAKTTLSCNLALYFAKTGLKVLLIDLDFINSRLGSIFRIDLRGINGFLNTYIEDDIPLENIINSTDIHNMDVITTDPEGDLAVVKSTNTELNFDRFKQMARLINKVREKYDLIIFDAEGSLDFNIINAFMMADIAFILSNGNKSSFEGIQKRSKLLLRRTGISVRNDYLIQTMVPETLTLVADKRVRTWKHEFEKLGIYVYEEPLIDEPHVREQVYLDNYFMEPYTKLWQWIEKAVASIPRLHYWSKLGK